METHWREVPFRKGLEISKELGTAGQSPRLHDQDLWSCPVDKQFGPLGSEIELWDFLYGFIRIMKPSIAVETGCYRGWTTYAMGCAMRDNCHGSLYTCDTVGECVEETRERCKDLPVFVENGASTNLFPIIQKASFLFSDSNPYSRMEEVDHLPPGAIAIVHDTYVYPFLGEWCNSRNGINFDTPRGFSIIRT